MLFNSIILLTATTLATPLLDKRGVFQNSCRKQKKHIGAGTVPSYGCPEGKWKAGALCYPNGEKTLLHPSPMQATCPDGKSNKDGLCYTNCPAGWNHVVTDCYQNCSGEFSQDCGLGFCSRSKNDCAQIVSLIGGVSVGIAAAVPVGGAIGAAGLAATAAGGSAASVSAAAMTGGAFGAGVGGAVAGSYGGVHTSEKLRTLPVCA